jgi:hypothetical protein
MTTITNRRISNVLLSGIKKMWCVTWAGCRTVAQLCARKLQVLWIDVDTGRLVVERWPFNWGAMCSRTAVSFLRGDVPSVGPAARGFHAQLTH